MRVSCLSLLPHIFSYSSHQLFPQAVIIPIIKKDADREPVMAAIARLEAAAKAAGIRVKVGARSLPRLLWVLSWGMEEHWTGR